MALLTQSQVCFISLPRTPILRMRYISSQMVFYLLWRSIFISKLRMPWQKCLQIKIESHSWFAKWYRVWPKADDESRASFHIDTRFRCFSSYSRFTGMQNFKSVYKIYIYIYIYIYIKLTIYKKWRAHYFVIFVAHTHNWVRSRNCGCLVAWFCYQMIAKPDNETSAVSWPDPYTCIYIYKVSICSS